MPLPEKRVLSIRAGLADRLPERAWHGRHHLEPMIHYYNSDVFLVPWSQGPELLRHWEGYLDRLAGLFPITDPSNRKIAVCDQASLALALERIQEMRLPVQRLPDPLHTTCMHLMAGAVRFEGARMYHAVHLLPLGDPGPAEARDAARSPRGEQRDFATGLEMRARIISSQRSPDRGMK